MQKDVSTKTPALTNTQPMRGLEKMQTKCSRNLKEALGHHDTIANNFIVIETYQINLLL